jgi:formylglycine-generating enzyme required for sulfatase activity
MMVVPAGEFEMGTSADEISQSGAQLYQTAQEQPVHHVSVKSFAIGKYSITIEEFNNFLSDAKINAAGCRIYVRDHLEFSSAKNWRDPDFVQADHHPVVCVSWDDAQNYISWLNGKIRGQTSTPNGADGPYRLPTEAEMEYATRAGTTSAWFWGYVPADQCVFANGADLAAKEDYPDLKTAANCRDGYPTTAPVGSLRPNPWNLYDMVGNVFQWTSDCWHFDYNHAPSDGRSWQSGDCSSHILRGGGWTSPRLALRSASRILHRHDERNSLTGFRIVRPL